MNVQEYKDSRKDSPPVDLGESIQILAACHKFLPMRLKMAKFWLRELCLSRISRFFIPFYTLNLDFHPSPRIFLRFVYEIGQNGQPSLPTYRAPPFKIGWYH